MVKELALEPRPFPKFVPSDAKVLFVGTFPTLKRNRDFKFYYGINENAALNFIKTNTK